MNLLQRFITGKLQMNKYETTCNHNRLGETNHTKQNCNGTISQCPLEPGPKLPMAHCRKLLQTHGEINTEILY